MANASEGETVKLKMAARWRHKSQGQVASAFKDDPLFGCSLLMKEPEAILAAHKRFLESGADIISTATYQANVDTLQKYLNLTVDESSGVIRKCVDIARRATEEYSALSRLNKRPLTVAGAVGPYGATLRKGLEYGGNYDETITEEFLKSWHRPRMEALVQAGIDIVAFETFPTMYEGMAVIRLLREFPSTKAWLSFSCKDGEHTCHGHPFAEAVRRCLELDVDRQLTAVGANCTNPTYVSSLLTKATSGSSPLHIPFVVYPNSGELWSHETKWSGRKDGTPKIASRVSEWMALGARYVGGCCRVTPDDIVEIAEQVRKFNGGGKVDD